MKKIFLLLSGAAIFLSACQNAPAADKANTTDKQEATTASGNLYAIDTASSTITWIGTKPTGQHTGTFKVSTGEVAVDGNNITGGSFIINITSLNSTDMQGEYKTKLDDHLKSADFFEVSKYPSAKFEITNVAPYDSTKTKSLLPGATHFISGNLTLKDSTKNVTFPAIVKITDAGVEAKANFNIDRTQWGLKYGSDASIQDKFISHDVNVQLDIKARK